MRSNYSSEVANDYVAPCYKGVDACVKDLPLKADQRKTLLATTKRRKVQGDEYGVASKQWQCGCAERSIPKLPFSSLSREDHKWYVENIARYQNLTREDQERMSEIGDRAAQEAEERTEFFRNLAFECQKRYMQYSKEALEFFGGHLRKRKLEVLRLPQEYSEYCRIPLSRASSPEKKDFLLHEKVVCQTGSVPILKTDNVKKYLKKCKAVDLESMPSLARTCVTPIESDLLASKLCDKLGANIVMTSESMTALMSLVPENFNAHWEIPITVSEEAGTQRKVVVADPLPEPTVSVKKMLTKVSEMSIESSIRESSAMEFFTRVEVCDEQADEEKEDEDGCTSVARELHEKLTAEKRNLFYSTWTFSKFRILVRYSYLGLLPCANGQKFACCGTKLEYSLYENYEKFTISEMMNWWSKLFIHPNSHLLLARVDADNESVARTERMNRATVDACRGFSFQPEVGLDNFNNVLVCIADLAAGSYLLSHSKGASSISCLSSSANEEGGNNAASARGEVPGPPRTSKTFPFAKVRGELNREIEYIPPEWKPTSVNGAVVDQIPGTFPPWTRNNKLTFFSNNVVRYCDAYMKGKKCFGGEAACPFPHLSKSEVEECSLMYEKCLGLFKGKKKVLHLKSVPHCFAYKSNQPCPFGGEESCPYPHLSERVVQELTKKLCDG